MHANSRHATVFGVYDFIERYLGGEIAVSVQARHMLFAADRWQAYEEMSGLLQSGTSLVADRYSGSGIAYGLAHGLEQAWLEGLERGLLEPDFTFMVDIPVDASFARKPEERDRYESRIGLLRRVREVYLRLAEGYGWTVLNGLQSPEELQQELLGKLAESGYSF